MAERVKRLSLLLLLLPLSFLARAQRSVWLDGLSYEATVSGTVSSGEVAPFWMSMGRHGISSIQPNNGYLRAKIEKPVDADTLRHWRVGYGADVAAMVEGQSAFRIQQLYLEAQYKKVRLCVGAKERPNDLVNDRLSTGGMTFSANARPIPQVRLDLIDWWNISGRLNLFHIKGHLAYGLMTDGDWQENFTDGLHNNFRYVKNTLYHSKAGYLKVGDEGRFPLTFTAGLQMVCLFGGDVYNYRGAPGEPVHMKSGLRAFWEAFSCSGTDGDAGGDHPSVTGNQVGSWVFSLDWKADDWMVRAYMDHYFDDHSQMFWEYGWKDNLIGVEARFPRNPYLSGVVCEFLNTRYQSGPMLHDSTEGLPVQISGDDEYYNNFLYHYQYYGRVPGNPLLISPEYNDDGRIKIRHSRIRGYHLGLSGQPHSDLSWRLLLTHDISWGRYNWPDDRQGTFLHAEACYTPHQLHGWSFGAAVGANFGDLIGKSAGAMITVSKSGRIF